MNPTPMQNTGFHPSPVDSRDYQLEGAQPQAKLPSFYKTSISEMPIFMQGKQPSCVAHAVTWYLMWRIWKKTGAVVKLSPRFLYALCKANDGIPDQEGTFYRVALQMAQKYGVCEDSFFSNNVDLDPNVYKDAALISPAAYENAAKYKIGNYFQVTDVSYSGLNNAVYQNGLALIGMRIGPQWWEREDGTVSWQADDILPLRPANPIVGGHAIVQYAFGQYNQYVMNWWSNLWGWFGHGWWQRNDLPFIYEAWVIQDLPKPVSPVPVKPPSAPVAAPYNGNSMDKTTVAHVIAALSGLFVLAGVTGVTSQDLTGAVNVAVAVIGLVSVVVAHFTHRAAVA